MNEELAARIKAGEPQYSLELWEQVRDLAMFFFRRLLASPANAARMERAGVTHDDLMQEGFLAVLDTVQAYRPESGHRFASFLKFHVMRHFFEAVGMRGSRRSREPLNRSASLEQLIAGEDGDITIADTIEDESAGNAFEEALERAYLEKLHDDLETCLQLLPPDYEQAIRGRYYAARSLGDLANEYGVSPERIRQRERYALRKLRTGEAFRVLRGYREEVISHCGYRGGLQSFIEHQGSSTERAVELLDTWQGTAPGLEKTEYFTKWENGVKGGQNREASRA